MEQGIMYNRIIRKVKGNLLFLLKVKNTRSGCTRQAWSFPGEREPLLLLAMVSGVKLQAHPTTTTTTIPRSLLLSPLSSPPYSPPSLPSAAPAQLSMEPNMGQIRAGKPGLLCCYYISAWALHRLDTQRRLLCLEAWFAMLGRGADLSDVFYRFREPFMVAHRCRRILAHENIVLAWCVSLKAEVFLHVRFLLWRISSIRTIRRPLDAFLFVCVIVLTIQQESVLRCGAERGPQVDLESP